MNPTVKHMFQRAEEILITLHSTGYFSEDEWIKVDGLLHKGQYVLTNGPPKIRAQTVNLIDASPLLSFGDDEIDKTNDITVEAVEMLDDESASSASEQKEVTSEQRDPSPAPSATPFTPRETPSDQEQTTDRFVRDDLHKSEYASTVHSETNDNWRAVPRNLDSPKPARPVSETRSIRPSSSASRSTRLPDGPPPTLAMGAVMRANKNVKKTHHIKLHLEKGDQVKVLKFVSGLVYYGMNLRTKECGQFTPDDVDTRSSASTAHAQSTNLYRLDNMETTAAAEWNDQGSTTDHAVSSARLFDSSQSSRSESISRPASGSEVGGGEEKITLSKRELDDYFEQKFSQLVQKRNAPPKPVAQGHQGLQASRYSNPTAATPSRESHIAPAAGKKKYVIPQRKVCTEWAVPGMECTEPGCRDLHYWPDREDQDFSKGPKGPGSSIISAPSRNTTSQKHPGKSGRQYCWYFVTPGKECRFTAEECGDLHELPPVESNEKEVPMHKITCYYWATEGETCGFEDGKCKYLHAWGYKVAPKPGGSRKKFSPWSVSRPQDRNPASDLEEPAEAEVDDAYW